MDPLKIIERLADGAVNPPTDAELNAAQADLTAAFDAATSADLPDLAVAKDLRAALDTVNGAIASREAEIEANREAVRALRTGVFEDETGEVSAEVEAEEVSAEVEAEEPVAVAASAYIARLRAAAETKAPVVETQIRNAAVVKSVGPASGFNLEPDAGFGALGGLFATHAKSIMSAGSQPLVRLQREFSDSRRLGSNVDLNNRKITDVLGFGKDRAVAAAGGLCGPGDVDHSHPICSERGRPVRDSMIQFNASRGTVTYAPAMSVGDLAGNVSIWTAATDAAPGAAVKPCPPLACPEELNASIDAVVKCITVGNFQAQFSPEYWAAALEVLAIEHDRVAEQKIIEEIHVASSDLGTVEEGNVLASFLSGINQIIASDRSANRKMDGRYTIVADAYIRDMIRNQVIKNLGVANNVEALQIADAQIDGWLSDVGATVVWTLDGTFDGVDHRVLTPGEVPTDGGVYVYPEDAFMFLDGGTLDLGTSITDSTLNATNDRQAFAETFEKAAFRGCSAYRFNLLMDTACGCPAPVEPGA